MHLLLAEAKFKCHFWHIQVLQIYLHEGKTKFTYSSIDFRMRFRTCPYFVRYSSHTALCLMTQLTNRNLPRTMMVMNDAQLSNDFDGLYLAKGKLIFALLSTVIHNITFSVVLSFYFAQKTLMKCKISIPCLFVYF